MEQLLTVYVDDEYELSLCDTIAKLDGVETVLALEGRDPDYVILTKPFMGEKVAGAVETLLGVRLVNVRPVISRQEGGRRIIDVTDIPGPLPAPNAQLRPTRPVITTADIPGPRPAMRASARVHHDFSSQAGLASFAGGPCDTELTGLANMANMAGMRGFGSGLPELGKLSY